METFRSAWLPTAKFVQNNMSKSEAGVLRGLHYHRSQEDLWFIPSGLAEVTLIDLRTSSPSSMAVEQFELSGPAAVYIPIGVGHGFYAPVETLMAYMVTAAYDGTDELGVLWNDPDLGIKWPVESPSLSDRDLTASKWADVPADLRPS